MYIFLIICIILDIYIYIHIIHVTASQIVWYLRIWMVAIAGRASAGPGPPLLRGLQPSVTWLKDGLLIS